MLLHNQVALCQHPVPHTSVRHHLVAVNLHLTQEIFLSRRSLGDLRLLLDVAEAFLHPNSFALKLRLDVVLQRVLDEHAAGHRVDRLLLHLLDLFHV